MMRTDADPPRGESEPSLDREVRGDVQRGAVVNGLGLLGKVAGPAFLLVVTRLYGAEVFGVFVTASSLVEIAVALLSVAVEQESLALVPMAVVYRFFYMFIVDVIKLLASLEEFLKLDMTWGKLDRTGSVQET